MSGERATMYGRHSFVEGNPPTGVSKQVFNMFRFVDVIIPRQGPAATTASDASLAFMDGFDTMMENNLRGLVGLAPATTAQPKVRSLSPPPTARLLVSAGDATLRD